MDCRRSHCANRPERSHSVIRHSGTGSCLPNIPRKQDYPMKYASIIPTLPRLLRAQDASDYVAGETVLAELRERYGVRPVVQKKGLTAYDRYDLDRAIEAMKSKRAK